MIEMTYKGKKKDETENRKKLPKNVRQIGEAGRGKKIYLEDYAVTFLHQVEAAVLLGEIWEREEGKYIFVHGAIKVSDSSFGEEIWDEVYREAETCFQDSEIIGWAQQVSEQPLIPTEQMNRIYKEYFDKEDTVVLLFEPSEKEDAVFVEENGSLKKASGYYVYYDKNKSMQEYMVARNQGKSVEKEDAISDKAIRNFRKKNEEKKSREQTEPKQPGMVRFLYGASAFLVLTILVIGVTMMNNYDKMKSMELTLRELTQETVADSQDAMAVWQVQETESETDAWKQQMTEITETESGVKSTETLQEYRQTETQLSTTESQKDNQASAWEAESEIKTVNQEDQTENSPEGQEASVQPQHTEQAVYTVREGDTLADICQMYYGNTDLLDDICTLNDITDPNHILMGQKIKLP